MDQDEDGSEWILTESAEMDREMVK